MTRPDRRQGGFTLVELMAACAITAVLATAMVTLGAGAHRDAARTADAVAELDDLRRALATLEDDLRAATSVGGSAGQLELVTAEGPVAWAVTPEHALQRATPRGAERWLRRLDSLAFGHADGLVEVELRFLPRPGSERGTRVRTAIAPRHVPHPDTDFAR